MELNEEVEQSRYASALATWTWVGWVMLGGFFLAYVAGWLSAQVAPGELPRLWVLPASEFLRKAGIPGGWGWVAELNRGDVLPLLGFAVLAAAPVASLLALFPYYARRRDWIYLVFVALQVLVFVLTAAGVFVSR